MFSSYRALFKYRDFNITLAKRKTLSAIFSSCHFSSKSGFFCYFSKIDMQWKHNLFPVWDVLQVVTVCYADFCSWKKFEKMSFWCARLLHRDVKKLNIMATTVCMVIDKHDFKVARKRHGAGVEFRRVEGSWFSWALQRVARHSDERWQRLRVCRVEANIFATGDFETFWCTIVTNQSFHPITDALMPWQLRSNPNVSVIRLTAFFVRKAEHIISFNLSTIRVAASFSLYSSLDMMAKLRFIDMRSTIDKSMRAISDTLFDALLYLFTYDSPRTTLTFEQWDVRGSVAESITRRWAHGALDLSSDDEIRLVTRPLHRCSEHDDHSLWRRSKYVQAFSAQVRKKDHKYRPRETSRPYRRSAVRNKVTRDKLKLVCWISGPTFSSILTRKYTWMYEQTLDTRTLGAVPF